MKSIINFYHQNRRYTSLVIIFTIATFISTTPVYLSKSIPSVKSAKISAPALPVSKQITVPPLTAKAVYISDMNSGVVLFAKNPNEKLLPASLTKIATAIVAMDYYDNDSVIKINNASQAIGSTADLKSGDSLTASDVLYALMISSGNDAAYALAENYPGGYSAYVDQMNQVVTKLGLVNTHFSNVSGVETKNHFTTAYDIARLAVYALDRSLFKNIVSTKKTTIKGDLGYYYPLESTNELLGQDGIYGVKTGWTPLAGECLVTYAKKDNHPIIISVLGSEDRFGETAKLVEWVYQNFNWE